LFIAAAVERTRNIRFGTGVISLPYHNPLTVANRVIQLDHQSRGRVMFGFGPGLLVTDAEMLGIDPNTSRDRMAQALDVVLRLLKGESVTEKTEWYNLKNARAPGPIFAETGDRRGERRDAVGRPACRQIGAIDAVRGRV
jgi:limonene 1,2-monooxygenase